MNIILKTILTTSAIVFSLNTLAEEIPTSSTLASQDKEALTHEKEEVGTSTFQDRVGRLSELKPEQLAQEQKALHEATQKMTPKQREEQREEMREELDKMSAEERQSLHSQAQTEEQALLTRERTEHMSNPQHEASASKPHLTQRKRHSKKNIKPLHSH